MVNYQKYIDKLSELVCCTNIGDAVARIKDDGVYSIDIGDPKVPLDVFVRGFSTNPKPKVILLSFNGAIPNRETNLLPHFSFLGVTKDFDAPLVAISDPSLYLSEEVNLAWYAGNQNIPDMREKIISFCEQLARKYQARLVLMGGSGGGFAALTTLQGLSSDIEAEAFVWNPQTLIHEYQLDVAKRYAQYCWGYHIDDTDETVAKQRENLDQFFVCKGVKNTIEFDELGNRKIVYLINNTDWAHLRTHMSYFFGENAAQRLVKNSFLVNHSLLTVGDWGVGHAIPSKFIIQNTIADILAHKEYGDFVCVVENRIRNLEILPFDLESFKTYTPQVYLINKLLVVQYALQQKYDSYHLIFYVLNREQRVAMQWDSATDTAFFDIGNNKIEDLSIRVYVRGMLGSEYVYQEKIAKILKHNVKVNVCV